MKKSITASLLLTIALAAGPALAREAVAHNATALKRITEQTAAQIMQQLRWMHQQMEQVARQDGQARQARQQGPAAAAGLQHRWSLQHRTRNQRQAMGDSATRLKRMLRSGRAEGSAGLELRLQHRLRAQARARAHQRARAQSQSQSQSRMRQGARGGRGAGHGRR